MKLREFITKKDPDCPKNLPAQIACRIKKSRIEKARLLMKKQDMINKMSKISGISEEEIEKLIVNK